MTAGAVPLAAAVTANEQAVIDVAAHHLADALTRASGESWTCPSTFTAEPNGLVGTSSGAVVVTSLLLPLADLEKPWPAVEQALHATYKALCESGDVVMICTILRHVDATTDAERAPRIRRRIRKLNLLATELSRQYGAFVIDLDRVLADVGGRRLKTDFRLGGTMAAEFAGKTVALSIATNALDAFAPVKIQDKARAILEGEQPTAGIANEQMMTDLMALGHGRRKQRVATLTDAVQEDHVGWLVSQVLKGRIGGREAFGRLTGAIRRRGARQSASLLVSGVSRILRPAEAGRRS
jgi:hypothetical protein